MPKSLVQNGAVRSALLLLATLIIWAGGLTAPAQAQTTKLNVAYTSTTTNFSIAWLAKLEGIFRKYNLDVELILMQGPSTYLPALLSGNIHILYGGGTAVSRAIAAADPNIVVIGTETRYVPLRLMVTPSVRTASDLKGKKLGVGRAGLDEYATLFYLDKNNLTPGKDVTLIYATGGILARAAQMKQGLYDGMAIPPPNEIELEKQGFRELAYFFDLRMAYAGIPYTVTRDFRDKNPRVLTDFMTAIVEAIQLYRRSKEAGYRSIVQITRQNDPILLEKTYKANLQQYDAIQGLPFPWQEGIESMINGFHARFSPTVVKNRDARPYLDPSFVQRAVERLGLAKK
jgi:ABC-type nitrate/sulfonate/bicarbonate transport system substrate-binding protein